MVCSQMSKAASKFGCHFSVLVCNMEWYIPKCRWHLQTLGAILAFSFVKWNDMFPTFEGIFKFREPFRVLVSSNRNQLHSRTWIVQHFVESWKPLAISLSTYDSRVFPSTGKDFYDWFASESNNVRMESMNVANYSAWQFMTSIRSCTAN